MQFVLPKKLGEDTHPQELLANFYRTGAAQFVEGAS